MKKYFLHSLLLFLLCHAPAHADALRDFKRHVDAALVSGNSCEKKLIVMGRYALTDINCQRFEQLSHQYFGATKKAMNAEFRRLDTRMKGADVCKKTCVARIEKTEISFIRLLYILDYLEYTRIN